MPGENVFIILFIVATAVAIAARRLRIPYTVSLVLAGIGLGLLHAFQPPHLTKELLFSVILPGLIFEAAFHVEFREFWRDRLAIFSLAVPGVIATIALITLTLTPVVGALGVVDGFTWRQALVFGAVVAATDPIAVVGLFKSLGAPKRLTMLVESESLLNDGTAIVFFVLVLGVALGTSVTAGGIAVGFVKILGAGVIIGTAVGLAVSKVIQRVDDPMIEITLTTIAAYGSFMVAEQLHYSGVIATVTAGMLCGNYGARSGMSPATRVAAETFWEYVAFALNSIVFLLIGLEVNLRTLVSSWPLILIAYLAMTLGRGAVVFGVSGLLRATRERLPRFWSLILAWGGLRGALSMVLALSLPPSFPARDLVITMTFGVVLLSILVQGLTMAPILRRLGVVSGHEAQAAYDFARGRLQAADAALHEVETMRRAGSAPPDVLATLQGEYERRVQEMAKEVESLHAEPEEVHREELRQARRHLLLAEKDRIIEARRQGHLDSETNDRLMADVDARMSRLESGDNGEPDGDDAHRSPQGRA